MKKHENICRALFQERERLNLIKESDGKCVTISSDWMMAGKHFEENMKMIVSFQNGV